MIEVPTLNTTSEIGRANRRYHDGNPGWYTVNRHTDLAIHGPVETEAEALRYARAVALEWQDDRIDLEARCIPTETSPDA